MAYVPVPKDLSKIKTKLAFNLTKRQLVCFSGAAAVGLPAYLFSRGSIGNSAAMFLMLSLIHISLTSSFKGAAGRKAMTTRTGTLFPPERRKPCRKRLQTPPRPHR